MSVVPRVVTVKLDRPHAEKLSRLAREQSVSKSEIVRAAIGALPESGGSKALADIADLVGALSGPEDLSTNPAHLAGLGRDHRRHRSPRRAP